MADQPQTQQQTPAFQQRLASFEEAISQPRVRMAEVRKLAFTGVPDSLRPVYWKYLLGYLPLDKAVQADELKTKRAVYTDLKEDLLSDPRQKSDAMDHPLSTAAQSRWHMFFKNQDIVDQIDKDVRRTFPSLHFFRGEHGDALRRLLFIYARLNSGILYVQGMNEIMGPIYYVFANDPANAEHAEADAFFCFSNLMGEIMDHFCVQADSSAAGVHRTVEKIHMLLQHIDPELFADFDEKGLDPRFYCLRWVTLLFSQEFPLPEVLRLWDTLLADSRRFEFMYFFAVAIITSIKEELLAGTFEDNLFLLQNFPEHIDLASLLSRAVKLRDTMDPLTLCSIMEDPSGSGFKRLTPSEPVATKTDQLLSIKELKKPSSVPHSQSAAASPGTNAGAAAAPRKKFMHAIPEGFLPPPVPSEWQ